MRIEPAPRGFVSCCRHCYDLTHQSAQEAHKFDALFAKIAGDAGYSPAAITIPEAATAFR